MRTNEEKLDLLADIIEPIGAIIEDKTWAEAWQNGRRAEAIKTAIKGHKKEIVEILARVDGGDPATYQIDGVALFIRLYAMLNRPDLEGATGLFTLPPRNGGGEPSGGPTASTRGEGN